MLSIVMNSRDDARFARVRATFAKALRGAVYEIIRVHDARSMGEGYNRGLARARGERLLFAHDDIEILCDDFAPRLHAHLDRLDLIGIAGTTKLIGPGWHFAGPPYALGQVCHDLGPDGLRVTVFGMRARVVTGIQAVDGVLIGVNRRVIERVTFDETIPGFHLYDIDFSYGAYKAGFSCAVVCDLPLYHYSRNDTALQTPEWMASAVVFHNKHKATLPPVPESVLTWAPSWIRARDLGHAGELMREQFMLLADSIAGEQPSRGG